MCWFLVVLFLINSTIHAKNNSLYTIDIPVENQKKENWEEDIFIALKKVLIRVSGNQHIEQLPSIDNYQKQTPFLIESYNYSQEEVDNQLILHIQFNPSSIDATLTQLQQNIWSEKRPSTLLWIEQTSLQETSLISNNSENDKVIQKVAEERGIQVFTPLLDLEDQSFIHETSKTKLSKQLQEKYKTEQVLIGQINNENAKQITATWQLYKESEPTFYWSGQYPSLQKALEALPNNLSNYMLANNNNLKSAEQSSTTHIEIQNINSFSQYQELISFLKTKKNIQKLNTTHIYNNYISLDITYNQSSSDFTSSLITPPSKLILNINSPIDPEAQTSFIWNDSDLPTTEQNNFTNEF